MKKSDEIIKNLAKMDPIISVREYRETESVCYYCRESQIFPEPLHKSDCLWLDIVESAEDIKIKEEFRQKALWILAGKPLETFEKENEPGDQ